MQLYNVFQSELFNYFVDKSPEGYNLILSQIFLEKGKSDDHMYKKSFPVSVPHHYLNHNLTSDQLCDR